MSFAPGTGSEAYLIVQRGGEIGARVNLDKRQITIGRNADNEIVLADTMVSRYHAVIQNDPTTGQLSIVDLGSTNGVVVNDNPIDPGIPQPLQARDSIAIGRSVFKLHIRPAGYVPVRPPDRANDPNSTQYLELPHLYS